MQASKCHPTIGREGGGRMLGHFLHENRNGYPNAVATVYVYYSFVLLEAAFTEIQAPRVTVDLLAHP